MVWQLFLNKMPPREQRRVPPRFGAADGRGRNYVFTKNNPDLQVDGAAFQVLGMKWMIWQVELALSGTIHVQGAVVFHQRISHAVARARLPGCHVEVMEGSIADQVRYCTQARDADHPGGRIPGAGNGPWEFGERPRGQGARSDVLAVQDMIRHGDGILEVAEAFPGFWFRNLIACDRYALLTCVPRDFSTYTTVLWGPSGSGKSRRARNFGRELLGALPDQFWLPQPRARGAGAWWTGYTGQQVVVIDEFYGWLQRSFCCTLSDRNPLLVEPKGGSVNFVSPYLVYTSNKHPRDWWAHVGLGPFARRIRGDMGTCIYMGDANYPTAQGYLDSQDYGNADYEPEADQLLGM